MNSLKTLSILLITTILTIGCENFDKKITAKIYEQYYNKEGFSQIVFPPQFVLKFISEENKDQRDVIKNMDDIRILTYEKEDGENKSREYYGNIDERLNNSGFEDMLVINEYDKKITVKIKKKNETIRELMVLSLTDDKFVMLIVSGKVDFNKIMNVAKDMDFTDMQDFSDFSFF
ncbi:DUF4252 domain-containing protein [Bacteroidota bacterium]